MMSIYDFAPYRYESSREVYEAHDCDKDHYIIVSLGVNVEGLCVSVSRLLLSESYLLDETNQVDLIQEPFVK
jgi:hypothetical protein